MYFNRAGKTNTAETLRLAVETALERDIRHLVVATNTGATLYQALEADPNRQLNWIGVTHQVGFTGPGQDEMKPDTREDLTQKGVKILTATHLFAGVDRALRKHFGGVFPAEIMAQTLRLFGQGTKVAVEVSVMALDAGLIPYGQEIISIGGSAQGADTALIISPAHSDMFFSTAIHEVICMPRAKTY
jgi:hypothetical protein